MLLAEKHDLRLEHIKVHPALLRINQIIKAMQDAERIIINADSLITEIRRAIIKIQQTIPIAFKAEMASRLIDSALNTASKANKSVQLITSLISQTTSKQLTASAIKIAEAASSTTKKIIKESRILHSILNHLIIAQDKQHPALHGVRRSILTKPQKLFALAKPQKSMAKR